MATMGADLQQGSMSSSNPAFCSPLADALSLLPHSWPGRERMMSESPASRSARVNRAAYRIAQHTLFAWVCDGQAAHTVVTSASCAKLVVVTMEVVDAGLCKHRLGQAAARLHHAGLSKDCIISCFTSRGVVFDFTLSQSRAVVGDPWFELLSCFAESRLACSGMQQRIQTWLPRNSTSLDLPCLSVLRVVLTPRLYLTVERRGFSFLMASWTHAEYQ